MAGAIFQKIPLIMSEVGAIEKGRKNQSQGYAFRGIDDVYSAFQGLLSKHGVFFTPEVLTSHREERQGKSGGNLIYTVLTVKYTFFADDGSSFSAVTVGEAMDSGDKSANKAMSAALKYVMLQTFCIPTEEDNDTENHTHEVLPRGAVFNQGPRQHAPSAVAPKVHPSGAGVNCSLCKTELILSKSGAGYYCPNFKDASRGEHSRFKVAELSEMKQRANMAAEEDVPF